MKCETCEGSYFLNIERLPQEILESDPKKFRELALEWINSHEGHGVEVCPRCLHEQLGDFVRVSKNRVWQQGGVEAVNEMELKMRTCRECGHVAEKPDFKCPICGAIQMGPRRPPAAF